MKKELKNWILYLIVGGIATLVEWLFFWIFNYKIGVQYLLATVFAYIISTFSNWLAGRIILFKESNQSFFGEIIKIYLVSIIGLILNLIIMWIAVSVFNVYEMIAKGIATVIVFAWNYLIRKFFIYK